MREEVFRPVVVEVDVLPERREALDEIEGEALLGLCPLQPPPVP
jgi:hypothetical protein